MKNQPPDFLVIGHICHDKIPGGYLPGGAPTYAGLFAARQGFHSATLSSFGPDFLFASQFADLTLETVPSPFTTVFENIYHDSERIQFLHQKATDLTPSHLPQHWQQAKTVLLDPICDEVSFDFLDAFDEKTMVCVCPQGWMRQWDEAHRVSPKPIENWGFLAKADIISMSENDVACDWDLIEKIAGIANLLLVTQGSNGATVFYENRRKHFPSYPATEVDPTGAGDIFAAAFTLHFSKGKNVALAVAYAHAAASLSVEGKGIAAIPDKKAVEERYRSYLEM